MPTTENRSRDRSHDRSVAVQLRPYAPADFDKIYEIDQACYEPRIAYSRTELRQYLRFPGADCVIAEAMLVDAAEAMLVDAAEAMLVDAAEPTQMHSPPAPPAKSAKAPRRKSAQPARTDSERPSISTDAATAPIGFCVTAHRDVWGYIVTMDVLAEYRRLGVASRLLSEAERRMISRGVREIGLETATDNAAAIAFWQKHGYRKSGVRKNYYPGGRDAYSMAKRIAAVQSAATGK